MRNTDTMNERNGRVKALVACGFGINCEVETAAAYRMAGAEAQIVHLNQLFSRDVSLHAFDILHLPGGFSFGDDLGSGKVLANKLRYKRMPDGTPFWDELLRFIHNGNYIFGICNGFQALVKTGLLPNISGGFEQEVTLATNLSGIFEDRWCRIVRNPGSTSPFLGDRSTIELPVRHGEGRMIARDAGIRDAIRHLHLDCLRYCDEAGKPTNRYPLNPNGSDLDCAGLTDTTGRILGIMPHPEAFLSFCNHPDWPRLARENRHSHSKDDGHGLQIFRTIVAHIHTSKCKERSEKMS